MYTQLLGLGKSLAHQLPGFGCKCDEIGAEEQLPPMAG